MGKNDVKTLLLHFVDLILEENTLMVHFDFPKAFFGGSRTQALGSQRKPNEHLILFFNRILVSPMSSQVTIREITFSEFRSISFFEKKLSSLWQFFPIWKWNFLAEVPPFLLSNEFHFHLVFFVVAVVVVVVVQWRNSTHVTWKCAIHVCPSPLTHSLSCTGSQACARTTTHTYAPLSCCSSLHPFSLSLSLSQALTCLSISTYANYQKLDRAIVSQLASSVQTKIGEKKCFKTPFSSNCLPFYLRRWIDW